MQRLLIVPPQLVRRVGREPSADHAMSNADSDLRDHLWDISRQM